MKVKRNIIKIEENLCNGCGLCAKGCHEGAVQVIDGKARLISELYCDGLGACIGDCPMNAISIEEKVASHQSFIGSFQQCGCVVGSRLCGIRQSEDVFVIIKR